MVYEGKYIDTIVRSGSNGKCNEIEIITRTEIENDASKTNLCFKEQKSIQK